MKGTLSLEERAPTVATTWLPVPCPTGSVQVICVCERVSTTHAEAPILTVPVVPKLAPATVTVTPPEVGPVAGVMDETVGAL